MAFPRVSPEVIRVQLLCS